MCLRNWLRNRKRCACCGASAHEVKLLTSEGVGGNLCVPCYESVCVHEISPEDKWIHHTERIRVWNDGEG